MSTRSPQERKQELASRNLYNELIALRDKQRAALEDAALVLKFEDLPWEENPQGRVRWYLHPLLDDVAVHSLFFSVQEIEGGGHSGKMRMQGGQVIYVWEGRGSTVISGTTHHWEAGDLINVPLWTEGVEIQHFNAHPSERVLLVHAEPNYVHSLGVDMGSGFEQLAPASCYRKP